MGAITLAPGWMVPASVLQGECEKSKICGDGASSRSNLSDLSDKRNLNANVSSEEYPHDFSPSQCVAGGSFSELRGAKRGAGRAEPSSRIREEGCARTPRRGRQGH